MRISLLGLMCIFAPAARAADLKIGPYLGHQNLKIHSKDYSVTGDQIIVDPATGEETVSSNSPLNIDESATSFDNTSVQGLRMTYDLGPVALRADLAFSRYVFKTYVKQDKLQISLGGQYNFFSVGEIRFYSFAGFGLSRNQWKVSGVTGRSPYLLFNYDLAVGSSIPLTQALSLMIDYKYSDAITKGESKSKDHDSAFINGQTYSLNSTATTKNITHTTQELTLGLMFSI
jgi:hypothetical protein